MSEVRIDNGRVPEQIRRMIESSKRGECYFCEVMKTEKPIFENHLWFVKPNDFPYAGSVHHHLIIPKRHIVQVKDVDAESRATLFDVQQWLEDYLKVTGSSLASATSLAVRSGDMSYTCATIDHLHFHHIVGEKKIGDEKNQLEDLVLFPVGYKKKTPTAP